VRRITLIRFSNKEGNCVWRYELEKIELFHLTDFVTRKLPC
jgi:hypothetical protein